MIEGTKERILRIAPELFAQNGYLGTSMDDISGQLGLTKADSDEDAMQLALEFYGPMYLLCWPPILTISFPRWSLVAERTGKLTKPPIDAKIMQ